MFLFDWFWALLFRLGFFKKEACVILVGLNNAGKTSLVQKLKYNSVHLFAPTQRPALEEVEVGNIKLRAWDLGGHEHLRDFWKEYYLQADAIVFVVDSADQVRVEEARVELQGILEDDALVQSPILVLGNKSDLMTALPAVELARRLGITDIMRQQRTVEVFGCSLILGVGYTEAFKWLGDHL